MTPTLCSSPTRVEIQPLKCPGLEGTLSSSILQLGEFISIYLTLCLNTSHDGTFITTAIHKYVIYPNLSHPIDAEVATGFLGIENMTEKDGKPTLTIGHFRIGIIFAHSSRMVFFT